MNVYFIGIGGIGVSALAQYYLAKGAQVSGSDLVSSEITNLLKARGARIFIGKQKATNIPKDVDLVIYSPAIQKDNPELKRALKIKNSKLKIKIMSYPEALGELTKQYFTIAVCGTHGKSTTTAMISLILIKAGLNPTVILGTKLREFGDSNFRMGGKPKIINNQLSIINNQVLVIEADEWHESFLNYWPKIVVLTNIEKEHLDYYKTFKNYILAFKKFIGHLPANGVLIANGDDKNISKVKSQKSKPQLKAQNFSLKQKEVRKLRKILRVPGTHNIYNALAALTCARVLNVPDKISFEALAEYKGSWRRFEERELKVENCKLKIILDYAHHPTEIAATLEAVREKYPRKKIWLIFQPHQYQRTYYLFRDFIRVLVSADVKKIIIPPIYEVAGREDKALVKKVSSLKLVEAINKKVKDKAVFLNNFEAIRNYVISRFDGDILIIMGAGNIYNLVKLFSEFSLDH